LKLRETKKATLLHRPNEELRDLCRSPNIVRTVKSRRLQCAGLVARRGHKECIQNFVGETSLKTFTWKTEKEM
jgi:hypothetical protein